MMKNATVNSVIVMDHLESIPSYDRPGWRPQSKENDKAHKQNSRTIMRMPIIPMISYRRKYKLVQWGLEDCVAMPREPLLIEASLRDFSEAEGKYTRYTLKNNVSRSTILRLFRFRKQSVISTQVAKL